MCEILQFLFPNTSENLGVFIHESFYKNSDLPDRRPAMVKCEVGYVNLLPKLASNKDGWERIVDG